MPDSSSISEEFEYYFCRSEPSGLPSGSPPSLPKGIVTNDPTTHHPQPGSTPNSFATELTNRLGSIREKERIIWPPWEEGVAGRFREAINHVQTQMERLQPGTSQESHECESIRNSIENWENPKGKERVREQEADQDLRTERDKVTNDIKGRISNLFKANNLTPPDWSAPTNAEFLRSVQHTTGPNMSSSTTHEDNLASLRTPSPLQLVSELDHLPDHPPISSSGITWRIPYSDTGFAISRRNSASTRPYQLLEYPPPFAPSAGTQTSGQRTEDDERPTVSALPNRPSPAAPTLFNFSNLSRSTLSPPGSPRSNASSL